MPQDHQHGLAKTTQRTHGPYSDQWKTAHSPILIGRIQTLNIRKKILLSQIWLVDQRPSGRPLRYYWTGRSGFFKPHSGMASVT